MNRNRIGNVAAVAVLLVLLAWYAFRDPAGAALERARNHMQKFQYQAAFAAAEDALRSDASLTEAHRIAGRSGLELGRYEIAVRHLSQIPDSDPHGLEARLLCAQVAHQMLARLSVAEENYRSALALNATNSDAVDGLARLLATCGRRTEAVPLILQLCQQGQASDLLFVLARESGALSDVDLLNRGRDADPLDFNPLLGLSRVAENTGDLEAALRLARQAEQLAPDHPAPRTSVGGILLQQSRFEELQTWRQQLPESSLSRPAVQRALGFLHNRAGDRRAALAAFLKVLQTAPDARDVCYQASQLLFAAGRDSDAQQLVRHLEKLRLLQEAQDRALMSGRDADGDAMRSMIAAYEDCGRLLEAFGWAQLARDRMPDSPALKADLQRLQQRTQGLPLLMVPDHLNPVSGMDASRNLTGTSAGNVRTNQQASSEHGDHALIHFAEEAAPAGLDFEFHCGTDSPGSARMYTFTGGGVGAVDIDADGYPDLAFAQGGPWQQRGAPDTVRDALFRNVRGERFHDITALSDFGATGFGQGVAVGDTNLDGFADIAITGIGCATLWLNQGDGTFVAEPIPTPLIPETDHWLTSCAIADLNQDAWPDLFLGGYLRGDDIFERICGSEADGGELCSPTQFPAADDRLLLSNGRGGFDDASARLPDSGSGGKSLGLLVFDPGAIGQRAVYVSNDTTPNALLTWDTDTSAWVDRAFQSGLAVSSGGKSEGSMGIALGDADGDGTIDLLTTNFLFEGHAFYQGKGSGLFRDERQATGIGRTSQDVLGFGTQFLDADLDGSTELFVANGHVDDLRHRNRPFRMRPDFFRHDAGLFHRVDADQLGPYFASRHLGRAAIRTDWNVDGRPDLVVTHLHEPVALLTNATEDSGATLSLRLISTTADRDSLCARVHCEFPTHTVVTQVTAGDGYLCSNERRLLIGCGTNDTVQSLAIHWPSGKHQVFEAVRVPGSYSIVEQRSALYAEHEAGLTP